MMTENQNEQIKADLRTAQNRMFPFVVQAMREFDEADRMKEYLQESAKVNQLYRNVHELLGQLINIPQEERKGWHFGVVDSGKRAIETLVNYFCPPEDGVNVAVNTENYVAFNKFSAVSALRNQKNVEFLLPFSLKMGEALTIDSTEEMEKAKNILQENKVLTLWIAWNSTSTGVREKIEKLVDYRNKCGSKTLIISDAASLPLFTNRWQNFQSDHLPDVFFFSLRKQGLPYEGPQDEANQAKNSGAIYLFNDFALQRAQAIQGESLYQTPTPLEASHFKLTNGEQRHNHIRHLLKLSRSLSEFLKDDRKKLVEADRNRQLIGEEIRRAFRNEGILQERGFELISKETVRSETAFIVKAPEQVKPADIIKDLKKNGVHISVSMHPQLPNSTYFRFACYPAISLEETRLALSAIGHCTSQFS